MGTNHRFKNRKDAGEQLGKALEVYRDHDILVLGIPRGGIETAYYVAKHLHAPMSFVVARKLGFPDNPEAAFGAVAEDGSKYFIGNDYQGLSREIVDDIVAQEQREIARRVEVLRHGRPLPKIHGRTIILVDDGIATGATLMATVALVKKAGAGKIVVAAPLAGRPMADFLRRAVDDVVILNSPLDYFAVSQGYDDFRDLSDGEVLRILDRWDREWSDQH